jgi:hypothetical protein
MDRKCRKWWSKRSVLTKKCSEKVQKTLKLNILPRFQLKLSQELTMIETNGFHLQKTGTIIAYQDRRF